MSAATRPRGAMNGAPAAHVAEVQKARLLAGAVRAVDELGYSRATVSEITLRARVSRRTFYDLFDNREDCLLEVLDSTVERVRAQLAREGLAGLSWCERVRRGLEVILVFLDRESALAQVCVVQSARGSQRLLERRAQLLGDLARVIDEGRKEGARGNDLSLLTAEGLVGAALSIVYARLLRGERESLAPLTGELMGLIALPYLGPAAARREQARPTSSITQTPVGKDRMIETTGDPLRNIPMRVTYRTMRVLEAVAEEPGLSNRALCEAAGISDEGQTSKLLARLERIGMLENTGNGHTKGEPNAWRLTTAGQAVADALATGAHEHGSTVA